MAEKLLKYGTCRVAYIANLISLVLFNLRYKYLIGKRKFPIYKEELAREFRELFAKASEGDKQSLSEVETWLEIPELRNVFLIN